MQKQKTFPLFDLLVKAAQEGVETSGLTIDRTVVGQLKNHRFGSGYPVSGCLDDGPTEWTDNGFYLSDYCPDNKDIIEIKCGDTWYKRTSARSREWILL